MPICRACGGDFPESEAEATHAYMSSSPECWAAYGLILEREYSDPKLFASSHRLTVDAYALQHPGDPSLRRAVQSFWIHGASLWMVLRMQRSAAAATGALKTLAGGEFKERPVESPQFVATCADLLSSPLERHHELAKSWAQAALEGWREAHHEFERLARLAES